MMVKKSMATMPMTEIKTQSRLAVFGDIFIFYLFNTAK